MTRMSPPMASIDDRINEWKRQWEKRVRADRRAGQGVQRQPARDLQA